MYKCTPRYNADVIRLLYLIEQDIFNWCVVHWRSKNKHHRDINDNEIGLTSSNFINYSTLNWHTIKRTCVFSQWMNKNKLSIIIIKLGEIRSFIWYLDNASPYICWCITSFYCVSLSSNWHKYHTFGNFEEDLSYHLTLKALRWLKGQLGSL